MMRAHSLLQGCQVHPQYCCHCLSEDDTSLIPSSFFEAKRSKTVRIIKSHHTNTSIAEPWHPEVEPGRP